MPFLSNAHTHSTYRDGRDTLPEMIETARQLGFVSLGFSEHAYQGREPLRYCMTPEKQKSYLNELRALQQAPSDLRIWAGLEMDALTTPEADALTAQADYVIGSTHYIPVEDSVAVVDGDPQLLKAYVDETLCGDGLTFAKAYFDTEVAFLLRRKPEIIGHFDLLRKYAEKMDIFHEDDPAYRRIALNAIEAAFPCGSVLEVNTGGMARGYLPLPYPTLELLCAWREMGGKVTITADCHNRQLLNHAFDLAESLIRKAGFKSVMRLGTGEALWDEIEL